MQIPPRQENVVLHRFLQAVALEYLPDETVPGFGRLKPLHQALAEYHGRWATFWENAASLEPGTDEYMTYFRTHMYFSRIELGKAVHAVKRHGKPRMVAHVKAICYATERFVGARPEIFKEFARQAIRAQGHHGASRLDLLRLLARHLEKVQPIIAVAA